MKTTPLKYFIYVRKSTDDEKHQVLSLPAQLHQLGELANHSGARVVETIEESRTAKMPGRPLFNAMLDRIERGEANGIICWEIDRLYRNPIDEGRVRWFLQNGVIRSIKTPGREYLPQDAGLLMAVEGGRAADHIVKWAQNLKRTHQEKLRRGQWPGNAPTGYSFDDRSKNIVPHHDESKAIQWLFNEFAKGQIGLHRAALRLQELGIQSKGGLPLSKSIMLSMLTNRIYMGVMVWKGETYEGKYTPLVSVDLFEQVQKTIKNKSKPRKVRHGHNFPFCGVFRCTCGAMITAQWAKGHGGLYRYYRCSRKSNVTCTEQYVREEQVIAQCLEKLRPFALSPVEAAEVEAVIDTEAKQELTSLVSTVQKVDAALKPLEEELVELARGLARGLIDDDTYQLAKEKIVLEKTRLKQEKQRLQRSRENNWIEPTRNLVNTLKTLGETNVAERLPEISGIVQKFGTNRLISRKTVTFSVGSDYDFIPSLLASVRVADSSSLTSNTSENCQSSKWCA